jgi:hypothetical protein
MARSSAASDGQLVHVVTLQCKDAGKATTLLGALGEYARPDALSYNCSSYEYGLKEGTTDTVYIVERWTSWDDLDSLLNDKVVPALPMYNEFLARPFDPARDTLRIRLSGG